MVLWFSSKYGVRKALMCGTSEAREVTWAVLAGRSAGGLGPYFLDPEGFFFRWDGRAGWLAGSSGRHLFAVLWRRSRIVLLQTAWPTPRLEHWVWSIRLWSGDVSRNNLYRNANCLKVSAGETKGPTTLTHKVIKALYLNCSRSAHIVATIPKGRSIFTMRRFKVMDRAISFLVPSFEMCAVLCSETQSWIPKEMMAPG
jgi:hypothetical protein